MVQFCDKCRHNVKGETSYGLDSWQREYKVTLCPNCGATLSYQDKNREEERGSTQRKYSLRCGRLKWEFAFDSTYKRLCLIAVAETEVDNIIFINIWTFGWRWPFIRHATGFSDK